jgi:hypothetical protein
MFARRPRHPRRRHIPALETYWLMSHRLMVQLQPCSTRGRAPQMSSCYLVDMFETPSTQTRVREHLQVRQHRAVGLTVPPSRAQTARPTGSSPWRRSN